MTTRNICTLALAAVLWAPGASAWTWEECSGITYLGLDPKNPEERSQFFFSVGQCMGTGEARLTQERVKDDVQALAESVYPRLREYKQSDQETIRVIQLEWIEYRLNDQETPIDEDAFVAAAAEYGALVISSTPSGATIDVDGKRWSDTTDTSKLTRAGQRTIELNKDGCDREEELVDVRANGSTTYHKDLTCN